MTLAQQNAQRERLLALVAEIDAALRALTSAERWECGERVEKIVKPTLGEE